MIDLGFTSPRFTWTNKSNFKHKKNHPNSIIMERLDKFYGNNKWLELFQDSTVKHLPRTHSDHRPLILNLTKSYSKPLAHFKFETMWLQHPQFHHIVTHTWLDEHDYTIGLKKFYWTSQTLEHTYTLVNIFYKKNINYSFNNCLSNIKMIDME